MCPAPTELLWTGFWQNQPGPKSPNQICQIQKPTRSHFNKRQFHAWWVAQLVASFEHRERHHMFCAATFPTILFFPQESTLRYRKNLRKALRLDRQQRLQEHVVSFHVKAYLWDKIIRVTPKSPGSTRDSQVRTWEERNTKSGWHSVQHASETENIVQKILGVSQRRMPREIESTRQKVVQNIKDQLRHDESSSAISIFSEKMHISIFTRFMASSMQEALHMDQSYDKNLKLFKNSEFENIKACSGLQEWWSKEIQKLRMYLPQMLRVHFGKNPFCLKNKQWSGRKQEYTFTRTPCYVWWKMHDPEDAIKRWNDQVSTLKMCPTFRIARNK